MKERPILFSAPMVRAILDGNKTQTRRILSHKGRGFTEAGWIFSHLYTNPNDLLQVAMSNGGQVYSFPCRYGRGGDQLWVRETFCKVFKYDDSGMPLLDKEENQIDAIWYRATDQNNVRYFGPDGEDAKTPWKPSIHMPRAASRIDLKITNIRVERLQDISEDDARAEGVRAMDSYVPIPSNDPARIVDPALMTDYVVGFQRLWKRINGDASWDANPWVWVVEFERVRP